MGALSPLHLILILVIALFIIGPGKLPETGAALGKAIRQFRDATTGADEKPTEAATATSTPTPTASPTGSDQTPQA
ncbi:MAG TPA: twin-arginine translocase TatA/TatE family subunit [Candidatus Saccharimonadales bacterium]|nr:twin-arginine translocase TatA/TatE family subunit [Candidatus Saccharimonadales bacterium]